jgi:succinoglycan biosynthesis protein ExoA
MTANSSQVDRVVFESVEAPPVRVSVAVPIRNEEAFIAATLDQLLDQELEGIDLEILVVDGQSTDKTREIVAQYALKHPQVRLLDNPKQLSSAARNVAIEKSTGKYVVIVDGHCEIPSRRHFREMVDAFEASGADCLGRPQPLDVSRATPLQRAIAMARSSRLGHHPESFIYADQPRFVPAKSVAVAYRREVFDKVGLFDEAFDAHEDGEFNYRCDQAGMRCYFTPKIAVKYFPRRGLLSLFKQMMRYGRGRVRFSRKHPGTWSVGALVPTLFVLYVLLGPLAASFAPKLWFPYFVGMGTYGAVVFSAALAVARRNQDMKLLLGVPVVLTTVHTGAGAGVLAELIGGRK